METGKWNPSKVANLDMMRLESACSEDREKWGVFSLENLAASDLSTFLRVMYWILKGLFGEPTGVGKWLLFARFNYAENDSVK